MEKTNVFSWWLRFIYAHCQLKIRPLNLKFASIYAHCQLKIRLLNFKFASIYAHCQLKIRLLDLKFAPSFLVCDFSHVHCVFVHLQCAYRLTVLVHASRLIWILTNTLRLQDASQLRLSNASKRCLRVVRRIYAGSGYMACQVSRTYKFFGVPAKSSSGNEGRGLLWTDTSHYLDREWKIHQLGLQTALQV